MTPEVKTPPPRQDAGRTDLPHRPPPPPEDGLERLRRILVGPDRELLRRLERKLEPDALAPTIEQAVTSSVRRDPRPLADALFPVMGPAIRRAISQALAGMLQTINQKLEHGLSLKGMAWRWEAIRTGTSFSEVVLRHTLLYRVEQVFLVHREAGLLLQHLTAPSVAAQPPDMVAGMLTAIQDFTRDSFQVDQSETLETMKVGELAVWVEQGPHALLAAVIRGHAPLEFRADMQRTLEQVEAEHGTELAAFDGDASAFQQSRPLLEALLLSAAREPESTTPWRTWVLLGLLLLAVLAFLTPRLLLSRRFHAYLDQLRNEPGVIVTDQGWQEGRYLVRGLRDPMARDPYALLADFKLGKDQVIGRWEPYVAMLPQFVLSRATRALGPPPTVGLRLVADTLVARGLAPESWFRGARTLTPALSGVAAYREERIPARELPAVAPLVAKLEDRRVLFGTGRVALDSVGQLAADAMLVDILRLDSLARAYGLALRVGFVGSADDLGTPETNERLRLERADAVRQRLAGRLPGTIGVWAEVAPPETTAPASEELRALRRSVRVRTDIGLPPGTEAPLE